jgi:plastocyanin
VRGTRAALIALVLGAALAVPALVAAADPATTTTETQTTTGPTVGAAPADTAPATDTVQTEPPSAAKPPRYGPAAAAQPAPRKQSPTASAAAGADYPVSMENFKFSPKTLTIKVGDKVTWSNTTNTAHNVTIGGAGFNQNANNNGDFVSHTFDQAGTFAYYCKFHRASGMKGTIKVEASGGSSGSGGTPSSGDTSGSGGSNGSTGSTSGSGTPASAATTGSSGSLPSTGADLLVLALLGGDLLLAGLVLREALAARRDYS